MEEKQSPHIVNDDLMKRMYEPVYPVVYIIMIVGGREIGTYLDSSDFSSETKESKVSIRLCKE